MKFSEVITNAYADEELLQMMSLIIGAHCGPSWKWNNRPHVREVLSLMYAEAPVMWFNSSAPVLELNTYTRDLIILQRK
jgi:hypothetical protein